MSDHHGEGNDGCKGSYTNRNVFNVGATDRWDYSRWSIGSCVSVFAPGVNVGAGYLNGFDCNPGPSGTSVAGPLVAGVVAALYEEYPYFSLAEMRNWVLANALSVVRVPNTAVGQRTTTKLIQLGCQKVYTPERCNGTNTVPY
jgi:subtilisin family serine protease